MESLVIPGLNRKSLARSKSAPRSNSHLVRDSDLAFKQRVAYLDRQRTAMLKALGLVISLFVVILAFEWKSYDQGEVVNLGMLDADFEELQDIPITNQEPPPPLKEIVPPQIVEVPDEEEIEEELEVSLDVEVTEETVIEEVVFEEAPEEEVSDEIFEIVEENATPAGGMQNFYKYFAKSLNYPVPARQAGVEGKVYLQFIVDKNGQIGQVKVLKGIGYGCDEEAARVVREGPDWTPAKQRGRAVNSRVTLPLIFKLT